MKRERKVYETKEERRRELAVGAAAWIGINAALFGLGVLLNSVGLSVNWLRALGVIALVINIGGLIVAGFTRQLAALGALAAFAFALVIGGLCFVSWCFYSFMTGE